MNDKNKSVNKPEEELMNAITGIGREPEEPSVSTGLEQASMRVWSRLSEEMQVASSAAGDAAAQTRRISGCDEFAALLPAYRAASLTPESALLMQDHLRECIA